MKRDHSERWEWVQNSLLKRQDSVFCLALSILNLPLPPTRGRVGYARLPPEIEPYFMYIRYSGNPIFPNCDRCASWRFPIRKLSGQCDAVASCGDVSEDRSPWLLGHHIVHTP
ncbi:hypothetical protein TNCV_841031 [Trichonephila clavipes]|nr:hypothetical protein TNCV_841031 [Trichonephila clavipes]